MPDLPSERGGELFQVVFHFGERGADQSGVFGALAGGKDTPCLAIQIACPTQGGASPGAGHLGIRWQVAQGVRLVRDGVGVFQGRVAWVAHLQRRVVGRNRA